ncbi:uncharacterized protein DS421_12g363520 [Arachis hypogaea]|nr:uncharacterized protein DS421_12g363520 [Arachis hypogaea]
MSRAEATYVTTGGEIRAVAAVYAAGIALPPPEFLVADVLVSLPYFWFLLVLPIQYYSETVIETVVFNEVAVISYVVATGEAVVVAGTITRASSILRFCIIGSSSGNCGSRLKLPPNRFVDRRCSVQPFFIHSGGRIRFVYAACSCFCFREGASRAEVLIVGDFGLSKKESVNKFGLWLAF